MRVIGAVQSIGPMRMTLKAGSEAEMPPMTDALNLVLEDRVVFGRVALDGERILSVDTDGEGARDEAEFLLPGLIDLHTDNLEHHFQPRPGVRWPAALAAVMAHDWQMLGAGVTTVLDSLSIGDYDSGGQRTAMLDDAILGLTEARVSGLLRADHYFHFRCELSDPALLPIVGRHVDNPALLLMSLMDHTPGQRQWHDLELYRAFRRKKKGCVWTDAEFEVYLGERRDNQRRLVPEARAVIGGAARARGIRLASHDDTTIADTAQSHADGISISEFPTTRAAAEEARASAMSIVMGAPNIVLGGSHSGNVGAAALADDGLLDILTSDYVPASLLHAAFVLAARGLKLADAVAMVTARPAAAVGLDDRGRIAPGLRADLLRVRLVEGQPVITGLWVAGWPYL